MENNSEIALYQTSDGDVKFDVRLEEEVVCREFRHTTRHGAVSPFAVQGENSGIPNFL